MRILFFAEAVTLAHVARCVTLADQLSKTGRYTVALAADNRYEEIVGDLNYERFPLQSISCQYFRSKLRTGSPIYSVEILSDYVKEDITIIEAFKPDFIFGDFRISLAISCQLAKIPYATITNAYWSPYANISYPIPEMPLTKIFGVTIAQKLFDIARPLVFKIHSLAFNKTCKKFGLSPLNQDMREIYTHADYTLYADIESLIPMKPLPAHHFFIGPVLWSARTELPAWWHRLPLDKPIIFVTLGSSGDASLLPMILESLSELSVTVICVTAKLANIKQRYVNVHVADFLPADVAVKKSDIIICNGGSPMVYQSLVENKPVIGIPSNLDQYLMMSLLEAANKGQTIRAGKANAKSIREAVERALLKPGTGNKLIAESGKPLLTLEKIEALIQQATHQ